MFVGGRTYVLRPPEDFLGSAVTYLLITVSMTSQSLANTIAIAQGPSRSVVPFPPITLTRTNLLPSLWTSQGLLRSRLSPRCKVPSLIPWIRQNSPRDRPLVLDSPTSRWTSRRVRRRRGLTSSGSVIHPLQQNSREMIGVVSKTDTFHPLNVFNHRMQNVGIIIRRTVFICSQRESLAGQTSQ
jgi:hypothetical protein